LRGEFLHDGVLERLREMRRDCAAEFKSVLTAGGGSGCVFVLRAFTMICSASRVPSRPQAGQKTGTGILPPTGSTSKEYFWPQEQMIFTGIMPSPEK
jgi:hypothetical protein